MREPVLGVMAPLPPEVYFRRPVEQLPYPLGEPGTRVFLRARHGLWHGVCALGLEPGDEVLVPAYHHGSEVEALVRAGLVCRFYEATETLEPDEGELEALRGPRTRALYLIHYLGLPQASRRWRTWADARELLLLEDAAPAWLATRDGLPVGSLGDLAIFCLYKTVGLPDGGAVVVRGAKVPAPRGPRAGLAPVARRHAAWLAARSAVLTRRTVGRPYDARADMALGDVSLPPSAGMEFLLRRLLLPDPAARRRAHYAALAEHLVERAAPGFQSISEGASPFGFPLRVPDKARTLAALAQQGVRGIDFWCTPHPLLDAPRYPGAATRRAETVLLPVHQELSPAEVERIAQAARRC